MFNFKSIVKQITDRGRDSNPESPSKAGAEDLSNAQKAEGFLCPKCMKQFASPFELQIHYESMHDDDRPNESSMHDLSGSLSSLSSKEKKDDTGGTIGPIDADIPDLSPSISVDDVLALTDVSDLQQRLRQTLLRKSVLESRVLELAQSNVGLKASVDDLQRSLSILNERHRVVEAQLAHRESIDDAAVLRQELIQVQRVMDEMNRERERERDALQAELQCLTDQQTPILEKLKMSLMEKEKKCAQLSDELAECKSKYETVKCQLTDLEGARKSKDNDFAVMKDTISSLEEELRQAHTDLQGIHLKVQQPSTQTKEDIDVQCSLDDSSLHKTDNGEKLERKLSECESQIKDLNQKLSSAHDRISHLEVEKAELVSKYGSCDDASSGNEFSTSALLEQLEAYKIENQKLERSNAELSDNQAFVNLEISNQINAQKRLQVQLEDSKSEMNQLRKCLTDCELSLEVKDSALRTMESQIQELKETVTVAKKNHVDMSAENKRLMEGKIHLEKEVSSSKEENLLLKTGHEELQKKLVDMEHEHQSVQEEHLQEIGRLRVTVQEKTYLLEKQEDAVMLLVNERAELDRRLESLRAEHAEQVEALKQQLKQTESGLREQEKAQQLLQTQLSSEVKKCETLEAEFQKLREFSDTAIQVKSDELKAMQASLDEAAGEKLALEAQLETAVAERQKLLERCYAATNEVEVLQHSVSDLRRKWDESEAALQELGRENATLQLDIEKLLGRKWTEDADVSSCTLCSRDFTMLLRKHHCRNCGQIFCNECSSKTAAVVSNKKPVRVCDSCYTELIAK